MKTINRFVGRYSFLSNFYPSTLYIDGRSYSTAEHAYQAYKTSDDNLKEEIRKTKTPLDAKKYGKIIDLTSDWNLLRIDAMKTIIREKFKNPLLRELLKETIDHKLIHENKFNDRFWGVCGGVGENWLGIIIEAEREKILQEDAEFSFEKNKSEV